MKTLPLVVALFVMAQGAGSQSLTIHKVDHTSQTFMLAQIDSITFSNSVPLVALHDPIPALQFNEFIATHNVHMTSDGMYIYTVNGGEGSVGRIKRYTWGGVFLDSVNIKLDMRSIMFNSKDGLLYLSTYGGSLYQLTNYTTGTFKLLRDSLFEYNQSSAALSADGNFVYAFDRGTLKKYDLSTGTVVQTLTGLLFGAGAANGDGAVAVDAEYIYTINIATHTVYVYTMTGSPVRTLTLPNGNWGFSLSYTMGYLFVARDGNYSVGTWYGYNIRRPVTLQSELPGRSDPEPDRVQRTPPRGEDTTRR